MKKTLMVLVTQRKMIHKKRSLVNRFIKRSYRRRVNCKIRSYYIIKIQSIHSVIKKIILQRIL